MEQPLTPPRHPPRPTPPILDSPTGEWNLRLDAKERRAARKEGRRPERRPPPPTWFRVQQKVWLVIQVALATEGARMLHGWVTDFLHRRGQ